MPRCGANIKYQSPTLRSQLSFAKNIAETYLSRSWSMYSSLQDPTMTHVLLADVDIDFRACEGICGLLRALALLRARFAQSRPLSPRSADVERLLAFDADVAAIPALLHRSRPNFGRVLQARITLVTVRC